ncbi:hypothetical protein [Planktothrix serta]|uniref:hypothetical protein n=1 Tax=Planktothrix serta TaxID=1678310 RepID=UPI0012DF4126|nr:hypothetical protein [Planktothrix serta]
MFLRSFLQDKTTPNTHIGSWVVIGFSVAFWPIILPLTHLERQSKKSSKNLNSQGSYDLDRPNYTFKKNDTIPFPYWRLKARSVNPPSTYPFYTLYVISPHRIQRKIRS